MVDQGDTSDDYVGLGREGQAGPKQARAGQDKPGQAMAGQHSATPVMTE